MEDFAVTGWCPFDNYGDKKDLSIDIFYEKDPKKKEEMIDILDKSHQAVLDYCVRNHIFYTDSEHQSSQYKCVPIVNNKWVMTYTLRAWSGLMADVWSRILHKSYDYLDFYCQSIPEEIKKFLQENNEWSDEPQKAENA